MYTLRTRFKKDIIAEFLPPMRRGKTDKVIIFCDGMPSVPGKAKLMEFFSRKGYWVFHPRYRGTWESDGEFLKQSPEKDITDVIETLDKPITDIWEGTTFHLKPTSITVIGVSFGGTAAVLASLHPLVTKAIAIAPVIDWRVDSTVEPMPLLEKITMRGFGQAYRFQHKQWKRLSKGEFYNPVDYTDLINPNKLLLIHAKDDRLVPYHPTARFAQRTHTKLVAMKRGGHLSSSIMLKPSIYKKVSAFLKARS